MNPIIRAVDLEIDLGLAQIGLDYSPGCNSRKLTSINLICLPFMKKDNLGQWV